MADRPLRALAIDSNQNQDRSQLVFLLCLLVSMKATHPSFWSLPSFTFIIYNFKNASFSSDSDVVPVEDDGNDGDGRYACIQSSY